MSEMLQQYAAVLPVKPPALGKSRLVGLPDELRRELAMAFAQDTVAACVAATRVGAVLVVTDDAWFSSRLTDLGCVAIPDGVSGDLNATLRQASAEVRRRWPELVPVALCADLPALRPADLDDALSVVGHPAPSFVPDAAGVGTTLYTAPFAAFDPHFGHESRTAHLAAGAREIGTGLTSLRQDVDDLVDLQQAVRLGVGPRTAALRVF